MLRRTIFSVGCLVFALTGCAKKPLTPVTSWADVVNDSLGFFTTSTDPGDQKVCYTFDWGDGSKTTTDYCTSGDTCCCSHEFSDTRAHYVKVRARNEKGAESPWSPYLKFQPSQAPYLADTIAGLRRWAADRWYHTSIRVRDPDGDSVAVKFVWDDQPAASWSSFLPSGSVVADSCRWTTTGLHSLRLVLRDKGHTFSRPSEVKTVSVSSLAIIWHNCDGERSYSATPTLGSIDGEPVLFCISDVATVDCYYLDGRLRWSVPITEGTEYAASLSPDGSHLYVMDYGLICLDTRSGLKRWVQYFGAPATAAVGPGGIIHVIEDNHLYRIRDCGDSSVYANSELPSNYDYTQNGVVVGRNGTAYVTGLDGFDRTILVAVDSAGSILWQDSSHITQGGHPVIDSQDRVVITDECGVVCFNTDGTLAWSVRTSELCPNSTVIGSDDQIVVTLVCGWVMGYDSSGRVLWTSTVGVDGWNTPCVARDSTLILSDAQGECVYCIGPNGNTRWEFSIWDSLDARSRQTSRLEGDACPSPVIGPNGDIYVACIDGIFCLAAGDLRMANTAWPTYNHDAARSGWAGRP